MTTEKIQTQIRAEIGWLWQREEDNDVQTSSGSVRFKTYKTDTEDNRIEGIWKLCNVTLINNSSVTYQLDYLTRPALGGTLDIGFLDVRAILITNHGTGTLTVEPGTSYGWSAPWGSGTDKNIVPSGGSLLLCAGNNPWSVTILSNKLKLSASSANCIYDIAVVGKIAETPSSSSSSSSSRSSSSQCSSSSLSSSSSWSSSSSSLGSSSSSYFSSSSN